MLRRTLALSCCSCFVGLKQSPSHPSPGGSESPVFESSGSNQKNPQNHQERIAIIGPFRPLFSKE